MPFRKNLFLFIALITGTPVVAHDFTSGMNKVKLTFTLNEKGTPEYAVYFDDKPVIKPSALGISVAGTAQPMNEGFVLLATDSTAVDETWKPVWGEVSKIRNHYSQLNFRLQHTATGRLMNIVFRIFEDGVGFRYEFPKQAGLKYFIITDELTHFNLAGNHKSFWIPGDFDTNEYPYTTSRISEIDNRNMVQASTDICVRTVTNHHSVQTPLMMKSDNGLYINIHEAAQVNYPAMQLHVNSSKYQLSSSLVPDAYGNKAYVHAPFHTPWRTIIVSDKAPAILASKMILNLNEPSKITGDVSWITPMKFVGVWWEMQTGKGGWNYADLADSFNSKGKLIPNGRHSANTANVKRYIDFAARNGIQGVLVEGWNTGWEDWFGNWKENVFDFVTPYPDFDVKAISEYARKKGVQMIMHNETSGSATNYERQMDTAFRFMKKYGYNAVKTGYVGKIIPRGEYHDGQWMVNHYLRVAEKSAEYKIMVDMHEPMRPTGLHRTYPNWVASEAGRGNEYSAFSNGNTPDHVTILPFTRLMGGPMDYTPGIFKLKGYTSNPKNRVNSTLAQQLALYITMYSPLQMAADLPENYEARPDAFQFIKDVPVDWDDTKVIAAEPGDYIVMARKEKGGANWYIGAVTDENSFETDVPLSFLEDGIKYEAIIYGDAPDANWDTNPEAYTIKKMTVDSGSSLKLKLAKGGGAAVSIMQAGSAKLLSRKK
ncbi:MAG TPA: glycoside hydrolase family 97 protein [Ferruginibacter sp.]|nr:glycoside hydrolase family 97 protein [Ferruginibacter sp.]HMP22386.1 glycoside hydrolase family 97 protein [Ferruginibacter sp.]